VFSFSFFDFSGMPGTPFVEDLLRCFGGTRLFQHTS